MSQDRFIPVGKEKDPFNDEITRSDGSKALSQLLGHEYVDGERKGIDLKREDNASIGAEGEDGTWHGDRWEAGQQDIFGIGIPTAQVEDRKWHYWNLQHLQNKEWNLYWIGKFDDGWMDNVYYRFNVQKDQIIIFPAEAILNSRKRIILKNRLVSNVTDPDKPEDWIVLAREHLITGNKQKDGTWTRDPYCGPTQEEFKQIHKKRAAEVFKNRNK